LLGIGRFGSVCGALTGGIMAVSIKYGTNEPDVEKRVKASLTLKLFIKSFKHNTPV
jgi:hypothetical protein